MYPTTYYRLHIEENNNAQIATQKKINSMVSRNLISLNTYSVLGIFVVSANENIHVSQFILRHSRIYIDNTFQMNEMIRIV